MLSTQFQDITMTQQHIAYRVWAQSTHKRCTRDLGNAMHYTVMAFWGLRDTIGGAKRPVTAYSIPSNSTATPYPCEFILRTEYLVRQRQNNVPNSISAPSHAHRYVTPHVFLLDLVHVVHSGGPMLDSTVLCWVDGFFMTCSTQGSAPLMLRLPSDSFVELTASGDTFISPGNGREISHGEDARMADCNARHSGAPFLFRLLPFL